MAKRYVVDLRSLTPAEKKAAIERLERVSFMVTPVFENNTVTAAEVIWDSPENFATSPALPVGCLWQEK